MELLCLSNGIILQRCYIAKALESDLFLEWPINAIKPLV